MQYCVIFTPLCIYSHSVAVIHKSSITLFTFFPWFFLFTWRCSRAEHEGETPTACWQMSPFTNRSDFILKAVFQKWFSLPWGSPRPRCPRGCSRAEGNLLRAPDGLAAWTRGLIRVGKLSRGWVVCAVIAKDYCLSGHTWDLFWTNSGKPSFILTLIQGGCNSSNSSGWAQAWNKGTFSYHQDQSFREWSDEAKAWRCWVSFGKISPCRCRHWTLEVVWKARRGLFGFSLCWFINKIQQ